MSHIVRRSSFSTFYSAKNESIDEAASSGRKLCQIMADSGLFSRRESEKLIFQRRVAVTGKIINRPTHTVSPMEMNLIEIDGVPLRSKYNAIWPRIWAVEKRVDEIMSDRDPNKSRMVFFDRVNNFLMPSIIKEHGLLKPIYRLDYKVGGLCLLTNSGELAKLLISPINPLAVHYKIRVHGLINDSKISALQRGLLIDNKKYRGMVIERLQSSGGTNSWIRVSVTDTQPQALQQCLQKVFLQPTRIICEGFGPFKSSVIFGSEQERKEMAVQPLYVEVKLPPELHAIMLRHMNAKHSLQPNHSL